MKKGILGLMSASVLVAGVVVPVGDAGVVEAATPNPASDFDFDSSTGKITNYKGSRKDVVIPSKIGVTDVKTIGYQAFREKQLTSVEIPEGVTGIEGAAFSTNQIKSIVIPGSVSMIDSSAFADNQLTSVVISEGVERIGAAAFSRNQITSVVIPGSVSIIDADSFGNNQLTSVVMHEGVKSIGNRAFSANQITSVVIPKSMTSIGISAFSRNQLTSVDIPDSITSIQNQAFGSNKLTNVVIPGSVTSIGDMAFSGNELTSIVIPGSVTSIGMLAFSSNELTSIEIPKSLKNIGMGAFATNKLRSVVIPEGVEIISMSAFSNNQLKRVVIPGSVTKVDGSAFLGNPLERVEVKGTPTFGEDVFKPSDPLTEDKVPIYGLEGSTVETYATANNHPFNPQEELGGSEQSQDVMVDFNGGDLSLDIPESTDFGTHILTGDIKEVTKPLEGLQVTDARGTGEGWSLSVSAGQLEMVVDDGEQGHQLKVGTLLLGSTEAEQANGTTGNLPTIIHTEGNILDGGSVPLSTAEVGSGKGVTDFTFKEYGLKLIIDPSDIEVDSTLGDGEATKYATTVEWSLVSGL